MKIGYFENVDHDLLCTNCEGLGYDLAFIDHSQLLRSVCHVCGGTGMKTDLQIIREDAIYETAKRDRIANWVTFVFLAALTGWVAYLVATRMI